MEQLINFNHNKQTTCTVANNSIYLMIHNRLCAQLSACSIRCVVIFHFVQKYFVSPMKLKTQIMRNISLNKFFIHSIRLWPAEGEANESARPAQKKPLAIAQNW